MKTEIAGSQNEPKRTWVTHPTKTNLFIILLIWVVGNGLLLFSVTDFFTESFFNKEFIMVYVMILTSTWTTVEVTLNYFKNTGTSDTNEKSTQ